MKDLSKEEIFFIKKIHSETSIPWDKRMSILMERFGKSERSIRRWIKALGFSKVDEVEGEEISKAKTRSHTPSKFYFVSWAQNATPVHGVFLSNMLAYAEALNAEVHIIPGIYRNSSSIYTEKNQNWWDADIRDMLSMRRLELHEGLTVLADVKISPTSSNPLLGFEGISGNRSSVIGHPRVHLKSLPVLDGYPQKLLLTTGAVTIPNYTDTRIGKTSEFHHTYGFVIVEVKNNRTHFVRQVTAAPDGSFCDLLTEVRDRQLRSIDRVEAFVMGDLHVSEKDEDLFEKTLEYLEVFKPKSLILHDVFSGKSITHHERNNPIKSFLKMQSGENNLEREIEETLECIEELLDYNPVIVYSNHHVWLDRWISDQDWKKELHNSLAYMRYASILLSNQAPNGLFYYLVKERFGDRVTCLKENDSFRIAEWELANHGHMGSNGSKGNVDQYRKFNTKVIVGDWHASNRRDGVLSVGTHSKLRMGFNNGPSSWSQSDIIIHNNGKAQHLIYFDNEFTTLWNTS